MKQKELWARTALFLSNEDNSGYTAMKVTTWVSGFDSAKTIIGKYFAETMVKEEDRVEARSLFSLLGEEEV